MKFRKHLLITGLALSSVGLGSCSIPKPECTVGQSGVGGAGLSGILAFAVRYTLVSGGGGACDNFKGEAVGFQSYHPAGADGFRDFSKTSIALRPHSLGELTWMNEDFGFDATLDVPNGLGDFTATDPDANDMCQVPAVTSARVNFPGLVFDSDAANYVEDPATIPATCTMDMECAAAPNAVCRIPADATEGACVVPVDLPATDLQYEWSNLVFYVTAGAPGNQLTADVKITLNGCTATYRAIGVWPAVDCTGYTVPGANEGDPDIVVEPEALCHPEPDAEKGRPFGSGINPDFGPISCDDSFAFVPVVDTYYSLPEVFGQPFSVPRCAITTDEIPALGGFAPLAGSEGQ